MVKVYYQGEGVSVMVADVVKKIVPSDNVRATDTPDGLLVASGVDAKTASLLKEELKKIGVDVSTSDD